MMTSPTRSSPARARATALLLAAAVSACHDAPVVPPRPAAAEDLVVPTRDTAASFQTDSLRYTLRAPEGGYAATIGVTFTNRTAGLAYFVNCGGSTSVHLEKLVDGEWRRGWSPVLPLCLSPPITVPVDRSHRLYIPVTAGYPGSNTYPQFSVADPSGVYRAVWNDLLSTYQDHLPFGEPLPLAARVSNRFVLTAEPR